MFDSTPFDTIKKFCEDEKVEPIYEKLLYHRFIIEYKDFHKTMSKDAAISDVQEKILIDSLLHNTTLTKNLDIVKTDIDELFKKKISKIERSYRFIEWLRDVGTNVLASVLFTILLIIIYMVAENQVKPLIHDFLSTDTTQQTTAEPAKTNN